MFDCCHAPNGQAHMVGRLFSLSISLSLSLREMSQGTDALSLTLEHTERQDARPTVLLFNVFLVCTFSSGAASESLGLESKYFVTVLLRAYVKIIIIIIIIII
jgi:uncharacterized membrane-anchored protein YitT (DUF2179 family)